MTSVPITTNAVTVTDNGSTVAVSVASSAVSVNVGTTGPQGATGPGVAAGGSTGQVLVKASGTNYDTAWTSSPTFGTATMTLGTATTLQAGTATLAAASIGAVSNAEIQYLDGLTEPLTTSLAGKAAIAPSLYMWPMVSGAYSSTQATTSQASFTEAREFTAALFMPDRDCTITKIACEVGTTAGSSGAVIRLGLRAYNATTNEPGNLIVDAGTVDATTAGVKEATISQALTKGTPYVITITTQGGAATKPNLIRSLFVWYPYAGNSTSASIVFYKTGVTGALDNTGSWTAANGTSAKVWVYTT